MIPYLLVGNPENRRVTGFCDALARLGQPPPRVFAWADVIAEPARLLAQPDVPTFVRLEACGESFAVERALLARGRADAESLVPRPSTVDPATLVEDFGRVFAPRQQHCGFLRVLEDLTRVFAERPRWIVQNPPAEIAELFDKRATARRFAGLGVPVPASLACAPDPEALREAMTTRAVYVKLSCGSSASCLALFRRDGEREVVLTSLTPDAQGFTNTLGLRRYEDRATIDRILGFLLREGSQVEESVPKAKLGGKPFDTRVVAVAGEPVFTLVRRSRHPITNLHLGGSRGDLAAFERLVPEDARSEALESCRRIGAHYASHHLGIDLLYESDLRGHRVVEANAFGDLLPGLHREGRSVYEWEILAALARKDR